MLTTDIFEIQYLNIKEKVNKDGEPYNVNEVLCVNRDNLAYPLYFRCNDSVMINLEVGKKFIFAFEIHNFKGNTWLTIEKAQQK